MKYLPKRKSIRVAISVQYSTKYNFPTYKSPPSVLCAVIEFATDIFAISLRCKICGVMLNLPEFSVYHMLLCQICISRKTVSTIQHTHFLTTEAMTIVHSGTVNDVAGKMCLKEYGKINGQTSFPSTIFYSVERLHSYQRGTGPEAFLILL